MWHLHCSLMQGRPQRLTTGDDMALEGKVKVFGQELPKKGLVIGGVVLGSAGGIYYYRQKKATAASSNGSPAGTIDPQTGDIAGSAQDATDLAALQQEQTASEVGSGSGDIIGYDSSGNPVYGAGGGSSTGIGVVTGYATNAQWGQAAEAALGSNGTDAIGAALGAYLEGKPLTTAQVQSVQEAIAVVGQPPVAGASGNPPGLVTTGGSTGTGNSGGSGNTGGTPTAKPASAPAATRSVPGTTSAVVAWGQVKTATGYHVRAWTSPGEATIIYDSKVQALSVTIPALKSKAKYGWHVAAVNAAGDGPYSPNQFFTTK